MKKYKSKGIINGIVASVSYGTNPLFALPMYEKGLSANSVLFYRYLFAVVIFGVWLKFFRNVPLNLSKKEFVSLFFLAILFALSSITLFEGFNYIDSGIACTILFIYPILVTMLSVIFFKEKITKTVIFSILLTFSGIFLLNRNGDLNLKGVIFVLLSAFVYAVYIVLVKNMKTIKHIKYDKLSFYVMLLGLSVFIINSNFCTKLQPIENWSVFGCAVALALFPTIISLETINIAIRLIGPTTTAILGALEPVTALFFGVLFFGEILTFKIILGIILILSGVILIILKNSIGCKK